MRTMIVCALAVLAYASPSIVAAQNKPAVTASGDAIQVTISKQSAATTPYVLAPQEFSSYAQPYLLETGMVLSFEQRARHYYARLRNEARVEIFPLAEGVFASVNGTQFVFRDEGDSIAISHLERLPFAAVQGLAPGRLYLAAR
ncbi:MAG: hypothetical protein ACEQSK_11125 [Sphingomonadaceae bacterium]